MTRTAQLDLPLVMPAQAQKHVIVNEALARLDALSQLRLKSTTLVSPPVSAATGDAYIVPAEATGSWQGREGSVAIFVNGGWTFAAPKIGWRAWDESLGTYCVFDGNDWLSNVAALSSSGAATVCRVIEEDHVIVPGTVHQTNPIIPANVSVLGITGRVIVPISGTGSWRLGVPGGDNRYGSGLGTAANSFVNGITGSPISYYTSTTLLVTSEAGAFIEGSIRLAVHVMELVPPQSL